MRFLMLIIPKGYESQAPGFLPDTKNMEAMMQYNVSLGKAWRPARSEWPPATVGGWSTDHLQGRQAEGH